MIMFNNYIFYIIQSTKHKLPAMCRIYTYSVTTNVRFVKFGFPPPSYLPPNPGLIKRRRENTELSSRRGAQRLVRRSSDMPLLSTVFLTMLQIRYSDFIISFKCASANKTQNVSFMAGGFFCFCSNVVFYLRSRTSQNAK